MKYNLSGSIKINLKDANVVADADSKMEVVAKAIRGILEEDPDFIAAIIDISNLEVTCTRKVFDVTVRQTFVNHVEIDTDDYPGIEDEEDAENYVSDHLDNFELEYDYFNEESDALEIECSYLDTEEIEVDCDD